MKLDRHLTDQQVAMAALEGPRAPGDLREHLAACPACQAQVQEVASTLQALALRARSLTPVPPPSWVRPVRPARKTRVGFGSWVWSGLLTAMLLALVVWLPGDTGPTLPEGGMALVPPLAQEDSWLDQVESEESETCQSFLCFVVGEFAPEVPDEFMDFMVPGAGTDVS